MNAKRSFTTAATIALLATVAVGTQAYADGAAYTMTNDPDDNQIVVFSRDHDGLLTKVDTVSTGGRGSGGDTDPLGSQGSLVLADAPDGRGHHHGHRSGKRHVGGLLLAVNAGSNDVSVFRVASDGIKLRDRTGSGGMFPVSLTVSGDMVYVLNNGAPANVTGFRLDRRGHLHAVPHSTRPLGDGAYGQV